jgi:hypothetical protein
VKVFAPSRQRPAVARALVSNRPAPVHALEKIAQAERPLLRLRHVPVSYRLRGTFLRRPRPAPCLSFGLARLDRGLCADRHRTQPPRSQATKGARGERSMREGVARGAPGDGGAGGAKSLPSWIAAMWRQLPRPRSRRAVLCGADDLARDVHSDRYLRASVGGNHRWHQDRGGESDLLSGARCSARGGR